MKLASILITSAAMLTATTASADWSGFYIGAGADYITGEFEASADDVESETFDIDGNSFNLRAGYDHQIAPQWVVGGFVQYGFATLNDEADESEDFGLLDVNAKIGYAASDNLMPFVTAGYSQASYTDVDDVDFDFNGYNVGAGVDYAINPNLIATLGVTYRDVTHEIEGAEDINGELGFGGTSIGLSLSYKF